MSLILDHINGVHDDNRLDNLQIVCANCAATLDTHCGRNNRPSTREHRDCLHCAGSFVPRAVAQRYCSRSCGQRASGPLHGVPRPERRRVDRPAAAVPAREVAALGWSGVGRKYGVSGNAVRKWMRSCELAGEAAPRIAP